MATSSSSDRCPECLAELAGDELEHGTGYCWGCCECLTCVREVEEARDLLLDPDSMQDDDHPYFWNL